MDSCVLGTDQNKRRAGLPAPESILKYVSNQHADAAEHPLSKYVAGLYAKANDASSSAKICNIGCKLHPYFVVALQAARLLAASKKDLNIALFTTCIQFSCFDFFER